MTLSGVITSICVIASTDEWKMNKIELTGKKKNNWHGICTAGLTKFKFHILTLLETIFDQVVRQNMAYQPDH